MPQATLLYEQIAQTIGQQISNCVLKPGDKLPSLRTISREKGVSISTAQQAYFELEKKGLIAARPQSGYYVALKHTRPLPESSNPRFTTSEEDAAEIIAAYARNNRDAKVRLSSGVPSADLLPVAKLNKAIIQATRELPDSGIAYDLSGNLKLKQQIAQRSLLWGGNLQASDILTTSGCMDALSFSLLSVAKRGDTIAVESPVYLGILQLARSLGLRVLEMPTHPETGIELPALKKALVKKQIQVCLLVSNFSNPTGACMPESHKREVVRLMEHYDVPLIEDDLYGDLYYGAHRPASCKAFDESGIVLWCGSFSKTLAPGYRVGWVAPGRFTEQVARTKMYHSLYCNTITHEAVASFLANGRYEHHLRKLRGTLHQNSLQALRHIAEYFPQDTKVSRPQGGLCMWVELNKRVDTVDVYNQAIRHKISLAPGRMYTLQQQYNNCMRISCGQQWTAHTEAAFKVVGRIIRAQ